MNKVFAIGVAVAFGCVAAHAEEVVDQSQTALDLTSGFLGIGGGSEQKLAQTFTAGLTGDLVALRLPIIGCAGGDLVIEIRLAGPTGGPDGALLQTTRIDPALAPVIFTGLHEFRLADPIRIRSGVSYAFTLRMDPDLPTSNCNFVHSPNGELYAAGAFYFDVRPNPPGWIIGSETGERIDLAFETIVDNGSAPVAGASRSCLVPGAPGGGAIPFPDTLPICRCLQDSGLREFRCALLHPDFFAIRRTPWPIDLGRPYTETWEILPLTKLTAPISVRLEGANIPQPVDLSFKGLSRKSVQARAVTLKAPEALSDVKGTATLLYGNESLSIDRTLTADGFADPKLPTPVPSLK